MRLFTALVVVALATTASAVQFFSSVTLRDRAEPGSWVLAIPQGLTATVARAELHVPLPQPAVLVAAREALASGDVVRGAALADRLEPGADKLALEGKLAQARGDSAAALRAYLAAGDLADVEAQVVSLRDRHEFARALDSMRALIAQLETDPTQRDTLAEAYLELGGLEEATAYRYWPTAPERANHQRAALAAYANALGLAPHQERYLISYGNQLLNLQRYADARATFLRASALDDRDSTALAGLGEAALGGGDRAGALAALRDARRRNPDDPAVVRLAKQIGA